MESYHCVLLCAGLRTVCCEDEAFSVERSENIEADPGSSETLWCQWTLSDNTSSVRIKWFKQQNESSSKLLYTAENYHSVSNHTEDGPSLTNQAGSGYKDRLHGYGYPSSSISMWHKHYITFLDVQPEDDGKYYCTVHLRTEDGTQANATSSVITLKLQSEY